MQDLPDEPRPTLISLFRRTTRLMVDDLLTRLRAAGYDGISISAHEVFESLPPRGARLTTIATTLGMTHQSAGEVVGDLERRGFLVRIPDPADRRARLVVLTDTGRELVRTALREIAEIEREWLARLEVAGSGHDLRTGLTRALRPPGPAGPIDDAVPVR